MRPEKSKNLRENHKLLYNKNLTKAIMKRSRLRNKANKSKDPVDIANSKNQRNLVVSLNRQLKSEYFNEVSNSESSRPLRDTCKPYSLNKYARGNSEIMPIESDKNEIKNEEVAKEFNQYFGHITDFLDLYELPYEKVCKGLDDQNLKLRNGTMLRAIFHLDLPLQKR